MLHPGHRCDKNGFSLIELAVVICILLILLVLLFPTVSDARGAARRMQCSSNLKNIAELQKKCQINDQQK